MSERAMEKDESQEQDLQEVDETAEAEPESQEQNQDQQESEAQQVSPETERKAREMGWVPQQEWRGASEAWRPADEFVKRGEEVLPIVRSNLERSQKRVHDLEQQLASLPGKIRAEVDKDYVKRFQRLEHMNEVALQRQRTQLFNEFETEKRRAAADGNTEEYDRLARDQREALANLTDEPEPEAEISPQAEQDTTQQAKQAPQQQVPQAVNDWVMRNSWFDTEQRPGHKAASAFAVAHFNELQQAKPWAVEDNLAELENEVRARFPEVFPGYQKPNGQTQPQRSHSPQVEGGGRQTGTGAPKEKSWNDIPPDDRKLAERSQLQYFLPEGVEIESASQDDLKKARGSYAREYWAQG